MLKLIKSQIWFQTIFLDLLLELEKYAKVSILIAYNLVHKSDTISLSKAYLNTESSPNDAKIEIPGYSNQPSIYKREGVCVYYKSTPPVRVLNIKNLSECINFEVWLLPTNSAVISNCIDLLFKCKTSFKRLTQF